jgi:hypothetical protein
MSEQWEDVRAVMLGVGDETPVGVVEAVELFPVGNGVVILTIDTGRTVGGQEFRRDFDALVSRRVRQDGPAEEVTC